MTVSRGRGRIPPHVVLLGNFGIGNLGNDASLTATVRALRDGIPNIALTCVCPNPERLDPALAVRPLRLFSVRHPGMSPIERVRGRSKDLRRQRALLATADALVVPGTGILDDFGGEPATGWPLTLVQWFVLARLRRVPIIMLSVGVGPFGSPLGQRLCALATRLASYRSVRDESSRLFLEEQHVRLPSTAVVPDVVFGLRNRTKPRLPGPNDRTVVIAVMRYGGWSGRASEGGTHYEAVLVALAESVLAAGARVRLLAADGKDRPAMERVHDELRSRPHDWCNSSLTCQLVSDVVVLQAALADARVVVATRYHTLVAALMTARPTVSIGYGVKNDDLMKMVGMQELCHHIDDPDPIRLRQHVFRFLQDDDALVPVLHERVSRLVDKVIAQNETLCHQLDGTTK